MKEKEDIVLVLGRPDDNLNREELGCTVGLLFHNVGTALDKQFVYIAGLDRII